MCLLNHEQSSLMTFAVSQKRASSIWLSFAHYIIKIDKKELQFYGLIRVLRHPLTL